MNRLLIAVTTTILLFGCVTEKNFYTFEERDSMMESGLYQCESEKVSMFYRYYVPSSIKNPPMIVFLHGAGGNGCDNKLSIKDSGFGNLSYFAVNTANSIIVVPQCPYEFNWTSNRMVNALSEFIPYCADRFGADKDRIYITGFSMGGIGTWKLIESYPEIFAAAVPVCGGPLVEWEYEEPYVSEGMKNLAIWSFNSVNDERIQNIYSRNAVSELWNGETTKAHYTESFNGHTDNWVYSNCDFMNWLYIQRK